MTKVLRTLSHDRRSRNRRFAVLVLLSCLTLTVYFAHHAMYGRFGIENNRSLSVRTNVLVDRLAVLKSERDTFERDISLLSDDPHPDIVEEASRRVLGFAYPRSRIVTMTR